MADDFFEIILLFFYGAINKSNTASAFSQKILFAELELLLSDQLHCSFPT